MQDRTDAVQMQDRCSTVQMQYRTDAGHVRFWTGLMQDRTGRMQDRIYSEQTGCKSNNLTFD